MLRNHTAYSYIHPPFYLYNPDSNIIHHEYSNKKDLPSGNTHCGLKGKILRHYDQQQINILEPYMNKCKRCYY